MPELRWKRIAALAVLCVAVPLPAVPQAPQAPFSAEVIVVLEGALAQNYRGGTAAGHALDVHLTFENGKVVESWGSAMTFDVGLHTVRVLQVEVTPQRIAAQIEIGTATRMDANLAGKVEAGIAGDFWVRGGKGTYRFEVNRHPSQSGVYSSPHPLLRTTAALEELAGTFDGEFVSPVEKPAGRLGGPIEVPPWKVTGGKAAGIVWAPREVAKGLTPAKIGERPRLLVRRGELPALRERLNTPLGKLLARRMGDGNSAVALGLMYQLTGDREYATRSIAKAMDLATSGRGAGEHETHQSTYLGDRAVRYGIAYDCCYDALDAKTKKKLEQSLDQLGPIALYEPWGFGSKPICAHGAGKADKMYAAGGMYGLALWGEKAPAPVEPKAGNVAFDLQKRFGTADGLIFEQAHQRWKEAHDLWQATEGANLTYVHDMIRGRQRVYLSVQMAIGEGGTGGDTHIYDYAIAYRKMTGRSVTGRPDISHAAARQIMQTVFDDDGGGVANRVTISAAYLSRFLALCPDDWKPAILWYWLKAAGISAADVHTAAGAAKLLSIPGADDPLAMVYTYLYFPLNLAPKDPAQVLPQVWQDKTHGTYTFRGGEGEDSIILQVSAAEYSRGGGAAADFSLFGLGQQWVHVGPAGGNTRYSHNVVNLPPGTDTNAFGNGKVISFRRDDKTGSGSITIDLNDVYTGLVQKTHEELHPERRGWLMIRRPVVVKQTVREDFGIYGLRAFGIDYSGASGAPGLLVIADKVTGDHRKEWLLNIPNLGNDRFGRPIQPQTGVRVEGNTFTIARGEATLKGTVVSPPAATVEKVVNRTFDIFQWRVGKYTGMYPFTRNAIVVTGDDGKAGDFLVAMTLQEGAAAPEVKVAGTGLDASVTVGRQTVRFDGQKVVFGNWRRRP